MKIAVISTLTNSPWGGSEELWVAMANEALKENIDVAVSIKHWPSTPPKILALQQKGAKIFQRSNQGINNKINQFITVAQNPFNLNNRVPSSLRELFNFNPDVICLNQGAVYDIVYWSRLLNYLDKVSIPYVAVCHLNEDRCFLNQKGRAVAIEFFERAARVAFVSNHNLRITERQLAKSLPNALVLQNPVNLSDLTIVPWPDSETVYMANVARLEVGFKGQDVLFEALSYQVWQSRNWRLLLYGAGPDKDYLEALAKHYGILERVEFRGHVKDVREIWLENHLLVLPSRSEGTPLALVEALLCGRPAVVTDVGGNAEWVEEQQTGFIAEAPTARSFGAALERAWLAQVDWKKMGIQAHEKAIVKFDKSPAKSLLKVVLDASNPSKST